MRLLRRRYRPKGYRPIKPRKFLVPIQHRTMGSDEWDTTKVVVYTDTPINAKLLAVKIFMATPEYQEDKEIEPLEVIPSR